MPQPPTGNLLELYEQAVLPALAAQLDRVFPEFGWRRDRRGWVATDEDFTHTRFGVRANRVVAHGPAPPGFLIHGGDAVPWTAYVSGGAAPRGAEFVRVVLHLAQRASVDPSLFAPDPRDAPRFAAARRRGELLEEALRICRRSLLEDGGAPARPYLEGRGLPIEIAADQGLGAMPSLPQLQTHLRDRGYRDSEISASGLMADRRWAGRVVGGWGDERGVVQTLWARDATGTAVGGAKYLYLRGGRRGDLPPYGLSDLFSGIAKRRRDVVLVEGLLDVHQFRHRGIENVVALGGTALRSESVERLAACGVERLTLCLDNDEAGLRATCRAVDAAARARTSPDLYVIDPRTLGDARDPDNLVRRVGTGVWASTVTQRQCAFRWRAEQLFVETGEQSSSEERRAGLARAGAWLGSLPARLSVEQEEALVAVADAGGYDVSAVRRAFRARFWPGSGAEGLGQPSVGRQRIDAAEIDVS